ncbi:uncharacterized protein LOC143362955 [Halictus rubicundus]|uniref:uncharacterized protein LOC143362955 n=1 Tax=Halictus rubicundus TaxID=77578 RepID=UPI00403625A4
MLRDLNEDSQASMAATKIQANFRGYRVRKRLEESKKNAKGDSRASNATVRQYGQTQDEHEQRMAELEEKSATKIQAGVRGFLVRKKQEMARAAATKIQAGFRGFKTRKQLKQNEQ